ncbi:MAG: YbaN family protein [Bacteroidales bacterium]|nr:YbaN family protein [Bacteroidales bacterium]MDD4235861.1 YbaN family protein [Bacteroidales bacterium]
MKIKKHKNIYKLLLIITGSLFLVLGTIGIVVPVLPTTPFLLLTALCYAKSSEKFYNWLINNKVFGIYIKNYREGKGIPVRVKLFAISLLWVAILISAFFAVENNALKILLIVIAILVSIHIITISPKKKV